MECPKLKQCNEQVETAHFIAYCEGKFSPVNCELFERNTKTPREWLKEKNQEAQP